MAISGGGPRRHCIASIGDLQTITLAKLGDALSVVGQPLKPEGIDRFAGRFHRWKGGYVLVTRALVNTPSGRMKLQRSSRDRILGIGQQPRSVRQQANRHGVAPRDRLELQRDSSRGVGNDQASLASTPMCFENGLEDQQQFVKKRGSHAAYAVEINSDLRGVRRILVFLTRQHHRRERPFEQARGFTGDEDSVAENVSQ